VSGSSPAHGAPLTALQEQSQGEGHLGQAPLSSSSVCQQAGAEWDKHARPQLHGAAQKEQQQGQQQEDNISIGGEQCHHHQQDQDQNQRPVGPHVHSGLLLLVPLTLGVDKVCPCHAHSSKQAIL